MFTLEELTELTSSVEISRIINKCRQYLLEDRLKVPHANLFSLEEVKILDYFSSLVMGGLALTDDSTLDQWRFLSEIAADFEYTLYLLQSASKQNQSRLRHIRRACILYEIAQIPGVSATLANTSDFPSQIKHFFTRDRSSNFGNLSLSTKDISRTNIDDFDPSTKTLDGILFLLGSLMQNHDHKVLQDIELSNKLFLKQVLIINLN